MEHAIAVLQLAANLPTKLMSRLELRNELLRCSSLATVGPPSADRT